MVLGWIQMPCSTVVAPEPCRLKSVSTAVAAISGAAPRVLKRTMQTALVWTLYEELLPRLSAVYHLAVAQQAAEQEQQASSSSSSHKAK